MNQQQFLQLISLRKSMRKNFIFSPKNPNLAILVQVDCATNQGPHDRNFLARSNNENFLRGAIERNTRLRQEAIFARASEALRAE